ncbi:MAG: alpha/beta fold hydrolase [Candidatus Krumholzibacteriota bacterium]|nr:alpha/beta fold hydrolase [Candidatus Krumholzibacteriota bacterium]
MNRDVFTGKKEEEKKGFQRTISIRAAAGFMLAILLIPVFLRGQPAEKLTIERMYRDPRLTGVSPRSLKWAPGGEEFAFIWNSEGERFYDIYIYNVRSGKLRKATEAAALTGSKKAVLSKAEIDRLSTLRRKGGGIFSYLWSPDGESILFPLRGDLYLLDAGSGSVRRFFRTEASETDPAFSPDGGKISFIRDNDIWILDIESSATIQLTDSGSETLYNGMGDYVDYEEVGVDRAYWWSPDGSKIAYFQTDVSPVSELLIPDYRGRFVKVRKQARPVAGGKNGLKRLGVIDLETEETVWIDPGVRRDEYIPQVHWHPGGEKLLFLSEPRDLKELNFLAADPEDGSTDTLYTVRDSKWVNIHNTIIRWGEGGEVFYFTSEESGWNHIYRRGWNNGEVDQITRGPWQVTSIQLIEDDGDIWYTSTEAGPAERHLFRLGSDGEKRKVTPGEGWYSASVSEGAGNTAVIYSNPLYPPDIYILESAKGEKFEGTGEVAGAANSQNGASEIYYKSKWTVPDGLERVTDSPADDLGEIDIAVPVYFTLPSKFDGKRIHALAVFPPEIKEDEIEGLISGDFQGEREMKFPAIISVHGGGYSQSVTKGWRWRSLFDTYLAGGKKYVILDLDYRGSSGYGRDWRTDVYLDIGGADLEDEITGLNFLETLPVVDPDRIGIWGWSYGGFMTTMAMLKRPEAFEAGAAVAPVNKWQNYDTHYTEERLGMPGEHEEAYKEANPLSYAGDLKNHLLIIHGMRDDNVHFQDTVQLVDKMIDSGVDFEVMFYPGGRHGIRSDASRIHLFRKITRHFERYLRGVPDAVCP